jgi:hypothetical protein
MRKADLVSAAAAAFGLMLLLVVIPVWVPDHEQGGYGLGARVMPTIAAALATALALLFLAARLLGRRERTEAERAEDAAAPISRANWLFLLKAALFLAAVAVLFDRAGFLAAGPVTVAGFMVAMGERRAVPIAATALIAAAAIWLFFWQLLSFPLP